MATRSEIWRTFWIRVPAANTGAERSASNTRAMTRLGAPLRRVRTSASGSSGPAAGSEARGRRDLGGAGGPDAPDDEGEGEGVDARLAVSVTGESSPPERTFDRRFLQPCTDLGL